MFQVTLLIWVTLKRVSLVGLVKKTVDFDDQANKLNLRNRKGSFLDV
jgi:hypothetical protein